MTQVIPLKKYPRLSQSTLTSMGFLFMIFIFMLLILGYKVEKRSSNKRKGLHLKCGISPPHSSSITLAFNLTTASITIQFHGIREELFITIYNFSIDNLDDLYDQLTIINRHNNYQLDIDNVGKYIPILSVPIEWVNNDEKQPEENKNGYVIDICMVYNLTLHPIMI